MLHAEKINQCQWHNNTLLRILIHAKHHETLPFFFFYVPNFIFKPLPPPKKKLKKLCNWAVSKLIWMNGL